MKNMLFIFAAAFLCVSAAAQNQSPRTTLHIDVVVEKQDIVAGPYARYAQKYLGVAAPLSDKVLHEIISANISDDSALSSVMSSDTSHAVSHMNPGNGFPKLTVDKTSNAAQSLEESARLAALKIFEIRNNRYDLISGNIGENVFGAGLGDALKELERLEEEYLSLFLGKQTNTTTTRQYKITPEPVQTIYTVCRFSDIDGLLPLDDLVGVPVVLELKSLAATAVPETPTKPNSRAVAELVPADMLCRIVLEGAELTSTVVSVYQFGHTIYR